jgi:hypothetical protein
VLLDLFPKAIKRTAVTGLEPILKSRQPRTQGLVLNVWRDFPVNERVLAITELTPARS